MIFTSFTFFWFMVIVFAGYWLLARHHRLQNLFLLVASYLFYGWVHPWFLILLASSTLADWAAALAMRRWPAQRRRWLVVSLIGNLGLLATFKYLGFFVTSWQTALEALGIHPRPLELAIYLPVGISFYTFQSLSYTIDVYRGTLAPRRSLVDFALFVSCFPQLVAGPIERASSLLPQVETPRRWDTRFIASAFPLLLRGFVKKLAVADNVAVYADQIFALRSPSIGMLIAGALAFAVQIYADFSGYTDIARGTARLIGFELSDNFRRPYSAISPSDFWRRWHISLSSWITDYLYIPLGGSRVRGPWRELAVLLATMGLAGLWHGAAWNFVAWGLFHAVLLFAYRRLGLGAGWRPSGPLQHAVAWSAMFTATLIGWLFFRAPSLGWLVRVVGDALAFDGGTDAAIATLTVVALVLVWSLPLLFIRWFDDMGTARPLTSATLAGLGLVMLALFARENAQDFIYFQF
jgi:D-alanyl-lipoteichoic acid acyltransferase DltB (MBOAT superfamily)